MGVGVVIVVLLLAGLLMLRGGAAGGGVLALGVALVLFCTTPAGDGLPGAVISLVRGVDSVATPIVESGERQ